MEEVLLLGLGAVAIVLSPFVPAVRPVARAGVKGGLVIRDAAVAAAGIAASQVGKIRSPWSSDGEAASSIEVAAVTVDVAPAPPQAATEAARKPTAAKPATAKSAAAKPAAGKSAAKKPAAKKQTSDADKRAAAVVAGVPAEATAAAATEAAEAATEAAEAATEAAEAPIPALVDVNGIGPKVAELLTAGGVTTLEELSEADPEQLRTILRDAGSRYRAMNPDTWPGQARALLEAMPRGDLDGDGIG